MVIKNIKQILLSSSTILAFVVYAGHTRLETSGGEDDAPAVVPPEGVSGSHVLPLSPNSVPVQQGTLSNGEYTGKTGSVLLKRSMGWRLVR